MRTVRWLSVDDFIVAAAELGEAQKIRPLNQQQQQAVLGLWTATAALMSSLKVSCWRLVRSERAPSPVPSRACVQHAAPPSASAAGVSTLASVNQCYLS